MSEGKQSNSCETRDCDLHGLRKKQSWKWEAVLCDCPGAEGSDHILVECGLVIYLACGKSNPGGGKRY